jgi:hypothetical protein
MLRNASIFKKCLKILQKKSKFHPKSPHKTPPSPKTKNATQIIMMFHKNDSKILQNYFYLQAIYLKYKQFWNEKKRVEENVLNHVEGGKIIS